MITTTTNSVEGHTVVAYLGICAGEAILGANVFKDFFASITDIVGGRSGTYEKELKRARDTAMEELILQAEEIGGNAVIGIDLDYEVIEGGNGNMLMVSASGTVVKIEKD